MRKKARKKHLSLQENRQGISYQNSITKEELIEIQTEAYYRAMKRFETEKSCNTPITNKDSSEKIRTLYLIGCLLLCPKKLVEIKKRKQMADGLLYFMTTMVMSILGFVFRSIGCIILLYIAISQFLSNPFTPLSTLYVSFFALLLILIGGMFKAASNDIELIDDKEYLFKYTGSIMSVLAFLLAMIALLK